MSQIQTLRLTRAEEEAKSLTHLFHRLNRIIPDTQRLLTVSPATSATEAIRLMQQHRFSQVPVVEGDQVLGVFSFRSFATEVIEMDKTKDPPGSLPVEAFMEKTFYARVTDEFRDLFERLDHDDAVLVGEANRLQAIVTVMDVLQYLYGVASPYVLLAEIELSVRGLIRHCVSDEQLKDCIKRSLAAKYKEEELPTTLEDMTFDEYIQLVNHGDNWRNHFAEAFGSTRERVKGKLTEIRNLRNDVFHFKREITVQEHECLANHREWLLMRIRVTEAKGREA